MRVLSHSFCVSSPYNKRTHTYTQTKKLHTLFCFSLFVCYKQRVMNERKMVTYRESWLFSCLDHGTPVRSWRRRVNDNQKRKSISITTHSTWITYHRTHQIKLINMLWSNKILCLPGKTSLRFALPWAMEVFEISIDAKLYKLFEFLIRIYKLLFTCELFSKNMIFWPTSNHLWPCRS